MSKLLRLLLPAVLLFGLIAAPGAASAQLEEPVEEPTEEPAEPVYEDITFYLHGTEAVGELDYASLGRMSMDTEAPTSSDAKSRFIINYLRGPNARCSGNGLLPSWDGFMDGRVQGDVKLTLHTLSHPGNAFTVELFADGNGACNEAYVEPVARKTVEFPAGQGVAEVVFEDVDFEVLDSLNLMVRAPDNPIGGQPTSHPHQGRVFYDSVSQDSRLELQCLLPEGKTTCLY
ncbi:MAG TPA: hypothetical protein VM307_15390 [Egibacteraceae bacterium]|nr:hypothetical protein [Egibacteraceae bacterium]